MKIATNVQRDAFGGITVSNLALFDWLKNRRDTIVGIEIISARHILGPVIFRHYHPKFFKHHIINGLDVFTQFSWEKMGKAEKKWRVLIDAVKDTLIEEAADIVLLNGTYAAPWILGQAANELGIPIVLRYAGVLQQEAGHKNFLEIKRLLRYEKWLAQTASTIIFPSSLCKKIVEKKINGGPIKNCVVIPNPVKTGKLISKKRNDRYTITAIGRWTPIKNFQAFAKIHNELLAMNWPHRAILVTSGNDTTLNFPESIERKDSMGSNELIKFYQSVDLVLVTSKFETFSNVAAEALVNGTSVLVSSMVGFSEILLKAGIKRMVIDSFEDTKRVAQAVQHISKIKLTKKEILAVASLLEPHIIHQKIISTLEDVLN